MAKSCLTLEELKKFPTIYELIFVCGKIHHDLWGLCQNDNGEIAFGKNDPDWLLQVTLQDIIEGSVIKYGEETSLNDIIFFYGVDISQSNNIYFDFIELSSVNEELTHSYPPTEHVLH